MKAFLFLALLVVARAASFGREDTNRPSAAKVAAAARDVLSATRASIGNAIEERVKGEIITLRDLDSLLTVLDAATNTLRKAALDEQFDSAAQMVETVRTQAFAVLADPGNKAMAAQLDPQQWGDEITRQKTTGKILESDIGRLRCTLAELRRWAELVELVAPPEQVASRLRGRLADLLSEWGGLKADAAQGASNAQAQTSEPVQRTDADPPANESSANNPRTTADSPQSITLVQRTISGVPVYRVVQVSPPVATVLRLAGEGRPEAQILNFIARSADSFNLNADQIIAIRNKVRSQIISAMLRRDGELRATAGARGWR